MACLERAATSEFGTNCRGSQVRAKRANLLGQSLWLPRFRTRASLDSEGAPSLHWPSRGRRRILIIFGRKN